MNSSPASIGILGGMGPAATVDLFDRIVRATPAQRDQDHIPILIVNDPSIPDRTAAILHGGKDPTSRLAAGIGKLAAMGADFIAIPCNTAHYYLPALSANAPIPLLDMIGETVDAVRREHPAVARVGVLATSGTLAVGLYQKALRAGGLTPVEPTPAEIERMMDAIYGPQGVKTAGVTDAARRGLQAVGQALIDRGAQVLILGCTEIPLALYGGDLPVPLVASSQCLAEAAVRVAFGS
ncbi:MAG: amino acid racemase [Caldilineaceae bacterium]